MNILTSIKSWFMGDSQESSSPVSEPQTQTEDEAKWDAWCNEPLKTLERDSRFGMDSDEVLYYNAPVEAFYMAVDRFWTGTRVGPSFRIARGLWLHGSTFQSMPVDYRVMKSAGSGRAYITHKKFAFIGDEQSIIIPLTSIVALDPYQEGVRITWERSKKPYTFLSGDRYLYGTLYKACAKFTEDSPEYAIIKEHQANQSLIEKAKEQGK